MAIDPPYRLDPFRNIVNVRWETQTEPIPPGVPEFLYAGGSVGVNITGVDGYAFAAWPIINDGPAYHFYQDSIPAGTTGEAGWIEGSPPTVSNPEYVGHTANLTAEISGSSATWRAFGNDGSVIGGPWTADFSGLSTMHILQAIQHDYTFDGLTNMGSLQFGGMGIYYFGFYLRYRY